MNPNDVVDQTQETLDWSVKNHQVPLIVSIGLTIILGAVLWYAFKVLITERNNFDSKCENWDKTLKSAQELQSSQQEVISQQQGIIADQQSLIAKQQQAYEEQKEMMFSINLNVKDINNKVDLVLRKEG